MAEDLKESYRKALKEATANSNEPFRFFTLYNLYKVINGIDVETPGKGGTNRTELIPHRQALEDLVKEGFAIKAKVETSIGYRPKENS